MQFALVDGMRHQARLGLVGFCPICGSPMQAKCGTRVIHHWAHSGRRNCDPWWENETSWHRAWKEHFPAECREVSHVAPDGEIHRADIKTPTGIYIEVQHSSMTDAEREAREAFYGNLIWVVDGRPFKDNFDLFHFLPAPNSQVAKDIVWFQAKRGMHGSNAGLFWRLSENPGIVPGSNSMVQIRSYREIAEEVEAAYCGHQQYDWVRPRRGWLDSNCPVYLDFGEDWMLRLDNYGDSQLRCVFRVSKRKFLHDVMTETRARDVATRFYAIG